MSLTKCFPQGNSVRRSGKLKKRKYHAYMRAQLEGAEMDWNLLKQARPIVAENLRKDFGAFCRAAWPHVHRGTKLSWVWAHDLICEYLVALWEGKTKRLIINCPPRFAKSTIVTILFPIWCWLQDP